MVYQTGSSTFTKRTLLIGVLLYATTAILMSKKDGKTHGKTPRICPWFLPWSTWFQGEPLPRFPIGGRPMLGLELAINPCGQLVLSGQIESPKWPSADRFNHLGLHCNEMTLIHSFFPRDRWYHLKFAQDCEAFGCTLAHINGAGLQMQIRWLRNAVGDSEV